jgi:aminoglycoside phosphotransferase (APT) family kinase protein
MTTPQWTADIEIDSALAMRLIAEQFKDLHFEQLEPFGTGWDNEAFLVDGHIVFRFPRRKFSAELIEREIAVLPPIAPQLPLAISAPAFIGKPTADYPCVFAGYELIEGTTACSFQLTDGDLYARHLVLEPGGAAKGVIDWGDVHYGDPALDLAVAHLLLAAGGHATFRAALWPDRRAHVECRPLSRDLSRYSRTRLRPTRSRRR